MIISIIPIFSTTSVLAMPANMDQSAVYTAAQGSIMRGQNGNATLLTSTTRTTLPSAIGFHGSYCNTTNGANDVQLARLGNATRGTSTASTGWNSWSQTGSQYIIARFPQACTVDATRVEWWTDGNVQIPTTTVLDYWNGTAWTPVTNMRNGGTPAASAGNPVTHIGTRVVGNWNGVTFDAVTTLGLRLTLTHSSAPVGMSLWEVFEVDNITDQDKFDRDVASVSVPSTTNVNFPLTLSCLYGSTVSWTSNNPAIVVSGATAVVTPPASGSISVTMTAVITRTGFAPETKLFTVVVTPYVPPYNLTLKPDNLGIEIAETLYGIFFEDINHSLDGGLNAQMIDNGSFQQYRWVDAIASGSTKRGPANGNYSQAATTIYAWTALAKNSSAGTATLVNTNPLTEKDILILPGHATADYGRLAADYQDDYNVTINITTAPSGSTATNQNAYGIAANGYHNTDHYNAQAASLAVNAGWTYNISFFVRGNYPGRIKCFLENSSSSLNSEVRTFSSTSGQWTKITTTLTATRTENNRLFIGGDAVGSFNLDFVTMKAEDSKLWRGGVAGGLRQDLAEAINGLNPKFMRFPGGCASEGMTRARQYFWKDGIYKNLEERRGMPNYWGYWNSNTLGFFEYFCFAEQLGAEPVPVISFGVTCQFHNGGAGRYDAPITGTTNGQDNLQAYKNLYLQDALDLIEFCNGDPVTTVWGAKRAEMGHPEPFNLKYVALGNENGGSSTTSAFWQRFRIMWDGIKAVYPDIEVITNSDYLASGTQFNNNYRVIDADYPNSIVDEHMYQNSDTFWTSSAQARYNVGATRGNQSITYDRTPGKPRVFVGEYSYGDASAANNQHRTAVAEAAYITMLERNSDIVLMSCYAPIVCKNNANCIANWHSNMIYVDNTGIWRTPNYYSTVLFANNVGNRWLNSATGGNTGTAAQQNARRMNYITRTSGGANAANTFTAPSIDTETGTIYCKLVNFENASKDTKITIENREEQWYEATWEYIWSTSNTVKNHESPATTHAEAITPIKENLGYVKSTFNLDIPMWSVGALVLTPVPSFAALTANGTAYTDTTTELTLRFAEAVPGLTIDNITVDGAYKGTLSGSGPSYTLSITGVKVEGSQVKVTVDLPDSAVLPASLTTTVHARGTAPYPVINVTANNLARNGGVIEGGIVAVIKNLTANAPINSLLLFALYNADGKMVYSQSQAQVIGHGDNPISISGIDLPVAAKDGYYGKLFLWDPATFVPIAFDATFPVIAGTLAAKYPGINTALSAAPVLSTAKAYQPQHDGEIVYGPDTKGEYWYWDFSTDQGTYNGCEIRKTKDFVTWDWVGTAIRVYQDPETGKYFHNYPPGVTITGFNEDTGTYTRRTFQFGTNFWAPYVFDNSAVDGYYYMYYCYSAFGTRTSDLGVYRCKALDGVWEFCSVLVQTRSAEGPGFNAIDPMVIRDDDGRLWLMYGSFFHGIALVELDADDPTTIIGTETYTLARRDQWEYVQDEFGPMNGLEGATIVYNPEFDYYYLIICYDYLSNLYNTRVARSKNVFGPYFDANGNNVNYEETWNSPTRGYAGTKLVGPYTFNNDAHRGWVGTGHAAFFVAQDGHHYLTQNARPGNSTGRPYINVRRVIWTDDGWPLASPEVTAGENIETTTYVEKSAIPANWEFIRLERIIVPRNTTTPSNTHALADYQFVSTTYSLAADGALGADGSWSYSLKADASADVTVDLGTAGKNIGPIKGKVYYGWDWESWKETLLFLGKDEDNTVYWGKQIR